MRLIDADALMNIVESLDWYTVRGNHLGDGAESEETAVVKWKDVMDAIEKTPSTTAVAMRELILYCVAGVVGAIIGLLVGWFG